MKLTQAFVLISLVGSIFSFRLGVKYLYDFKNVVHGGDVNREKAPQYEIRGQVSFVPIWENAEDAAEQILQVELIRPALMLLKNGSPIHQASSLDSNKNSQLYIHKTTDNTDMAFSTSEQDLVLKNLLKGVTNLLKFKTRKELTSEMEKQCEVISTSDRPSTNDIESEKVTKNCQFQVDLRKNVHYIRSPSVLRTTQDHYKLSSNEDFKLKVVRSVERLEMASNLWKSNRVSVQSTIYLELKSEVPGMPVSSAGDFSAALKSIETDGALEEESVLPNRIGKQSDAQCDVMKTTKSYKKYLNADNLSKMISVSAFTKLLKCFRVASADDIKNVLKAKEFKKILPQILDIVAFTGTKNAVDAAFGVLNFEEKDSTNNERYLIALSMIVQPTEHLIRVVLNTLNKISKPEMSVSEETLSTFVATLGALVKTLDATCDDHNCKQVVSLVGETFEKSLAQCDTESCQLMYLRGLRNAAIPSTISLLMDIAMKKGKPAHDALVALKNMKFQRFSSECEKFTEKILYQIRKTEDTSNRILAAEMLLECYTSRSTLKHLVAELSDQSHHEMSTLLTSIILQKMKNDHKFRSDMLEVLQDVRQYHALAQKGNSVSFTNPLMPFLFPSSGDTNGTYHVHVELLSAGVAKKCSVDINLNSPEGSLHLLTVGAVTDGLEGLVSDSSSADPDAVPTAAVELSISGVALRPKVLFSGTSNLMGLVFSGAGSEKTPILQGNYLFIDFSEEFVLRSGLPVRLMLEGVASNDLSGSIQISLWNRNSQSEITDNLAVLLRGSTSINTNFAVLEDEFVVKTSTTINIQSDSEFYEEPYKMCTQLMHPELVLNSQSRTWLNVPGHKALRKTIRKKNWTFPSRSYLLHRKNSDMCSAMNSY